MTPQEFVTKWHKIQQKETAVSQSHFNDVCRLVGHPLPVEHDPTGKTFSFETRTVKPDGRKGFADVFFKDHFIWEYKGPHKDLDKAYRQLQLYREDLQNPPLLITSDIHTIIIHTNFNNYPTEKHVIDSKVLMSGKGMEWLQWAFFDPDKLKPAQTQQELTKAGADTFIAVADAMKKHQEVTGEAYSAEQLAHFMARLLFTLFAEDMDLLQEHIFTSLLETAKQPRTNLQRGMQSLFREMRTGGIFNVYEIRHFNGTLFDDDFVPTIPDELAKALLHAASQDWSAVDPSIFGTLFERVIDEGKRAQLGAHYTSIDDIMLIVEPVLMEPLRKRWNDARRQANQLLRRDKEAEAHTLLADLAVEIAAVRVLDPACGSGNFLYVALRQLLDLQKQVIAYAERKGLSSIALTVSPEQLYGIEINIYAHELAQITAWIGYLQWRKENGFGEMDDPVLRPLHNIKNMDAILAYDADGNPVEPEWPAADVIIGNPPFIGGNKIRQLLGDEALDDIFSVYDGRVPAFADLVCYWFEKTRTQIEQRDGMRAGLLATSSIRGGANREVLKRIKKSGDIFMAWSDNEWVLDGAAVRVSLIGFDDGAQVTRQLDGRHVSMINSDLTYSADLTTAVKLAENKGICLRTDEKGGPFDISDDLARQMLGKTNSSGKPNTDVIFPWVNGLDIVRRNRHKWIIDFGINVAEQEAKAYRAPYRHVKQHVKPMRANNRMERLRKQWWLHRIPGAEMREALTKQKQFIVTPALTKHRLFVWLSAPTIPDHQLYAFAREDDYFFGVLHSRLHELWALRLGTSLGPTPRYTPTTTFETYPFPWRPGEEPSEVDDARVAAIAEWALALVEWRQAWLNPPRKGMNGGNGGIDTVYEKMLKKRTLTNLYNGLVYYRETRPVRFGATAGRSEPDRSAVLFDQAVFDKTTRNAVTHIDIEELDDIHIGLDNAVLDAYGWPHTLTDEQILERLLALNLKRARENNE